MTNNTQSTDIISRLICVIDSIIKQWRILILVACLSGVVVDVIKTIRFTPLYSANAVYAIVNEEGKGLDNENASKAQTSIRYLFNSPYLKDKVNQQMNQTYFDGTIYMSLTDNTNLCSIQVQATSQKNAYFQLKKLVEVYEQAATRSSFGYHLVTVEDISFSNYPINSNHHVSNYKKGFIISFGLLAFIIGLMNFMKDNIKTANDIQSKLETRLFAKVPKEIKKDQKYQFFKNKKSAILVSHFKTSFAYVEALNKLASKLEESASKHHYQTILLTSSLENEGKSSVAVNLAISLAKNKKKVLLIDADLRKPSLHKIFERKVKNCFVDVLEHQQNWQDCLVSLEKEHIDVIFSKPCNYSQDLFMNANLKQLFASMKKHYDYIIVDSAPSRYIADTSMMASQCDATLLVVKQNDASCKMINDTIYHLANSSANIIGAVYNASVYNPMKSASMYGYRYGYYHYHRERRS